ncbi:MAG: MmgE/PrpD family protein, partial [Burkholderiales bacterium]|nr:MmgE/PrpD family protein [Burkholderiales bacterium]
MKRMDRAVKPEPNTSAGMTATLAGYASSLKYEDIPQDVRQIARQGIIDWLGSALAGAGDRTTEIVIQQALEEGGFSQTSIVGRARKVSAIQSALINGVASHVLDYDDKHFAVPGHPSAPVLPVVFALAELRKATGKQVITAYIAGLEIACRAGLFMTDDHYERGWHASGTMGTFGAAAAAANLLNLTPAQCATALGIAGTQAAGLKSMFGTMCKALNVGKACSNGLYAAQLAGKGFTSNGSILETDQGYVKTHSNGQNEEAALKDINKGGFHARDLLFKYHASCYATHAPIEAAIKIRETTQFDAKNIEGVVIRIPRLALGMCNIEKPVSGLEIKFSLRMTTAMALAKRSTSSIESYSDALCDDPELV